MHFTNNVFVSFALAFSFALGGCANTAESGPNDDGGERTYATACGAMSARCAGGDASSCEKADSLCSNEAGLDALPGVSEQMIGGECSTMCCAACTRCANGDDNWCGYCMSSCSLTPSSTISEQQEFALSREVVDHPGKRANAELRAIARLCHQGHRPLAARA